jgi:TolA-binding protein
MSQPKTPSTSWALILISVALAGAGVSYHFTLESRFASIEQKLDQNSIALQQYQIAQETLVSSKSDALANLGKEVDALQSSLTPLGQATREQTESLSDIRKQISSLQQSQQAQQDAQKKLAEYAAQLEKMKSEVQAPPVQVPITTAPASVPASVPVTAPQASTITVPLPLPPLADSAVDLRPAQITVAATDAVRAFPIALPVALSSANR